MGAYKSKHPTKDGRQWFYRTFCTDVYGGRKPVVSKKFKTKAEALKAEREFLEKVDKGFVANDMTFQELYDKYREYQDDKVKKTTKKNYDNKYKHIIDFMNVKCTDYTIEQFETWRSKLNRTDLSTNTKNDIYKFWKSILNFGAKWYNLDFNSVYRKMINFTDPNEVKKEMDFYTYEEFQKFISQETDLRFKVLFETLYFCGLRRGEARGLTWDNINFEKKTLSITKQVISEGGENSVGYYFSSPKTKKSYRTLPICDVLYNDLVEYYKIVKKAKNFNEGFFVLGAYGGIVPFSPTAVRKRKKELADAVGLKDIRLHDFRHSCASLLINSGANITIVANFLGHTKIEETLNTYSHMFQSALGDVMNIMNNLN